MGEDAAEAIRSHVGRAEVVVMSTIEEATRLISGRAEVCALLVISPREALQDSPVVTLLRERGGALLLLLSDMEYPIEPNCRTLKAELPFTNETIIQMLEELYGRMAYPAPSHVN